MGQILNRRRVMGVSPKINWADEYLTFEALESGTFQFTNAVEYSLNNGAWTSLAASTATPTLAAGDLIRWRATITPTSSAGVGTFSATCYYNAMGNPLSLNLGDSFVGVTTMPNKTYMFYKLFYQDAHIKSAENMELVCTVLRDYCYYSMFYQCVSLTSSPHICATQFSRLGCCDMFNGCINLINVQPIKHMGYTTTYGNQFDRMFKGCTSITSAKFFEVTATTNLYNTYNEMFGGCTSLVDAGIILPAVTTTYSYPNMFYGCVSLKIPPTIYISGTLTACGGMFRDCTSLEEPPLFVNEITGLGGCERMFQDCSSLKSFPKFMETVKTTAIIGYMFTGCSSIEGKGLLLSPSCNGFNGFYQNCKKINYIKCLFEGTGLSGYNFTYGVAANGTFVKHPDATWSTGQHGIPTGWTVLEAVQITVTYTGDNSGAYLKEIGGSEIIHTFIDGEPYEADLDDNKSYGVYDSNDNLVQTLATPFSRTVSITI